VTTTTTAEPMNARPRLPGQLAELFADGWPAFIGADQKVKRHIGPVRDAFADLELVLLDPDDVLVAAGWAVPIIWDGEPAGLPEGYTGSLARSLANRREDAEPDTLVVMAAQVHPQRRGQGLAGDLLTAMTDLADRRGWPRVVAPVRPTLKARYPLTPIERFATWSRADGAALDPWVRTHQGLGARVIATTTRSQTMTGSVAEWEGWTGLTFPDSGDYVIPDGLSTLRIDRDRDGGIYHEPGVWLRHR
jgi:GNAT superfamily N-acetyltransferase